MKPPERQDQLYGDDVLYGPRREATRLIEFAKANNNPDCIILTTNDTIVDKQKQWNIKHLTGLDKRLQTMAETMDALHALPIQRFCWPQIHLSHFPFVCVAPRSSGKTFTHLFYILAQCISDVPIAKTNEIISLREQRDKFVCELGQQGAKLAQANEINLTDLLDDSHAQPEQVSASSVQQGLEVDLQEMGYSNMQPVQINPDDFITHPKYIVVCSSQNHVETIGREIDRMKLAAFGSDILTERRNKLPPRVTIIHVHQSDEKLAIKFNGCDVLVATPGALYKCIKLDLVDFTNCRRLFFDDIDLSLQLHNSSIREIFKLYVVQMHDFDQQQQTKQVITGNGCGEQSAVSACKIHMFSRKWTDLMKHSINTVFKQHFLIFGSIAEASVYGNLRYEIEHVNSNETALTKLRGLVELYESTRKATDIMAITCGTNSEARLILSRLDNSDQNKTVVSETDSISTLKLVGRSRKGPVYIVSDSALEFTISDLNCVTHLVHFTLPSEMIMYDQRFRLMYKHLISSNSSEMISTVFLWPQTGSHFVKELYDVISRSNNTLRSTKLELRDLVSEKSNQFCWRWASTGLCRLEKLSKDDRFGSFCPDRHSFLPSDTYPQDDRWPNGGQVKLTVTCLVNPNEFYFWFEARRDKNSLKKSWRKFESTGSEFMLRMQQKLDKFKNTSPNSVPLRDFNQSQVYGVYFQQEAQVHRVLLLDKLNFDHLKYNREDNLNTMPVQFRNRYNEEYKKQVQVLKIDYGTKVSVYLRNIFVLPQSLASIERQCFRGFLLGVKPTDNEPDWLYKAKKNFHELICVEQLKEVTAWIRLQNGRCFWFDNMLVSRELPSIGVSRPFITSPHEELIKRDLAIKCSTEPALLPASEYLETSCKWETDNLAGLASWAFLRRDKEANDVILNHVIGGGKCLEIIVRQSDYNKQLIELENQIQLDHERGQLQKLSYFAEGVLCVAVFGYKDPTIDHLRIEYNRARIKSIIAHHSSELNPDSVDTGTRLERSEFIVECLDHGDQFTLDENELFMAKKEYIMKLPFQAIKCPLADMDTGLMSDQSLLHKTKELLYDLTRTESGDVKFLKSKFKDDGNELYLYVPYAGISYAPIISLLEERGVAICNNDDPDLRKFIEFVPSNGLPEDDDYDGGNLAMSHSETILIYLIQSILDDIIAKELGVELDEPEVSPNQQ